MKKLLLDKDSSKELFEDICLEYGDEVIVKFGSSLYVSEVVDYFLFDLGLSLNAMIFVDDIKMVVDEI